MTAPREEDVRAALRRVIDPEVGLDVLTMGLIYKITAHDDALAVEMTLTTRGCPMGAYLTDEVREALGGVPGVRAVDVQLVFDPPWHAGMIEEAGVDELRGGGTEQTRENTQVEEKQ